MLNLIYFISNFIIKNKQLYLSLYLGHINCLLMEVNILIDVFRSLFLATVLIISFSVFRFSYIYISHYKFYTRFHILLFIFVCSILILIFSSNLLFTIIGWDGLGVSSYLLVIFYGRRKSYNAGMLTVLRNRLGDVFIILCIGYIIHLGSWNINFYKELLNLKSSFVLLLVLGAFTKRAQIPFRAWLPAAIAAPTPVSSLVHSSTLVTAGIYLLFRHLNEIGNFTQFNIILVTGVATIIIARLSAFNEKDIKKIVALSTLRQLGLIITRLGSKWIFIGYFHLIVHAFFKAIIFISIGNLIQFSQFYQSIKSSGRVLFSSPFNRSTLVLARFSLCGIPFAAAFFSKEPIIEWSVHTGSSLGLYFCLILRVFITIIYSSRLIKVVLLRFNGMQSNLNLNESDILLRKGIIVLCLPSFLRGATLSSIIIIIPKTFIYPIRVKSIIFCSVIFFSIFLLERYKLEIVGSVYFFPIWRLALFSRSLFNSVQNWISWVINIVIFSYNLKLIQLSVSLWSPIRRSLFSINFIFRAVISIPLFFIFVSYL